MKKDFLDIIQFARDNYGLTQHTYEISSLIQLLNENNIKSFMEIGTFKGGTMYLFSKICSGKKISVDFVDPSSGYGREWNLFDVEARNQSLRGEFPDIHFIEGNSHSQEVILKVREMLGAEKIDFLFIDGDHTYDGVRRDYLMYREFVKKGGYIAFHDIIDCHFHQENGCDVFRFWNEVQGNKQEFICRESESTCFLGDIKEWGGIGVIKNI